MIEICVVAELKTNKTMKTKFLAVAFSIFVATQLHAADPRTNSWFTTYSAKYARVFTNDAAKAAGNTALTWSDGTHTQSLPAYCGVQEIYSSSNWVYIRSSGLGIHTMGPWYLNVAHTQIFPNFPINTKTLYRIPRTPNAPASKTLTGLGAIGYFVDGVAMFDTRDAFYWNGSAEAQGTGYWNREAYVNEGVTFDPGYAHQPQDGSHHYHAQPIALRYLLGDHVDYSAATKTYSEGTNALTKHSPILGWVRDGYPIYGPYGFSNATNAASGIRRMISGYVIRDGQYGTSNLTANGRTTIPQWAVRLYNVASNILSGPAVSTTYPLGRYMEDNDYLGDHGYVQGVDFDLNEYNGRFCVTPEFPNGTYAYFASISPNGTPTFPYNIGRAFYGDPTGAAVTSISETVVTNFIGGPNATLAFNPPTISGSTVTLVWSSVEGGTYSIESSTNLPTWNVRATNVASQGIATQLSTNQNRNVELFRVARTALANFDPVSGTGGGSGNTSVAPGGSSVRGTNVTVTITLPTAPPQPPANNVPTSVTLAGTINGTSISRPDQGTVVATFAIPANAPTGAQNIVVTFNPAPTYTMTGAFTINP